MASRGELDPDYAQFRLRYKLGMTNIPTIVQDGRLFEAWERRRAAGREQGRWRQFAQRLALWLGS